MKNVFNRGLSFIAVLLCIMTSVDAAVATAGWDKLTTGCKEKLFPVTSGGSKDEKVSCTFHDKVNDLIIVAGNSTSEDYAPAANDHAFAYALDMDGNWVWGKFFYNVSFAISTISGCTVDANGNVVFLGMGNQVPVIMELAPKDGQVLKFVSFDKIGSTDTSMPWYGTYGAIHHDIKDDDDQQPYYYAAFVMENALQMLKVNSATYEIKWNYQYKYEGDTTTADWKQKKIPGFLHQDPKDNTRMYLLGQQSQRASVIKFQKRDMTVDWKLEITEPGATAATLLTEPASAMNEIYGYVQPPGSNQIYACGYAWDDARLEKTRTASMFQMDDEGDVTVLYAFGDAASQTQHDVCRAVAYDDANQEILFALEATSPSLRPAYNDYAAYSAANADVTIIRMKPGGKLAGAYNINFYDASISIGIGANALFTKDGEYIFGTQSWGYYTKYQNVTYNPTAVQLDTNVFRYIPGSSECFYQASMNAAQIINAVKGTYQASQIADKQQSYNLFQKMNNLFLAYSSRYSGSFDLGDTMKYPKMCAASSINMTVDDDGVQYYRGQNAARNGFQINKVPGAPAAAAQMDNGQTFLFENGTLATGLIGRWDAQYAGGTIFIHTDSQEAEGKRRTILRGCSNFDELYELYLYVNVIKNTYPDFVTEIETSWTLSVGQELEYKLPALKDDEANDEPELYIANMTSQPFPPFLFFNNDTNTLKFTPHSIWYQGMTYYFIIIVKEKHSDSVFYPYYCTVKMSGAKVNPETYLNFTNIDFEMSPINRYSQGYFRWSKPVNLEYVKDHWEELFDVYVKNVTFREHNTTTPLLGFKFTHLGDDNMTMNYTAKFYKPYFLGLLMKKSDKLHIQMKYDLLDTKGYFKYQYQHLNGMFLGNVTLTRIKPETCAKDVEANMESAFGDTTHREKMYVAKRIGLQFNFETNEQMAYMRQLAIKTYWYLCGVVILQFLILFIRNVGFLPVWTIVEYMQLVSFIPLYNFRMIPYLYDAFKPFLVSHLVLTNETFILKDMQNDYFNENYDFYWLSVAKLGQSLFLIFCLACVVVLSNIVVFLLYVCAPKQSRAEKYLGELLAQYKFNVYLRLYMLCYFDLTFFSTMKIVDGDDSTQARKVATMSSYVIFTISIVVPVFLMSIICKRFEVMKIKQAKASFNTVVLKIDKQSRWRLIQPGYFFFRRLLTAVLLSMPIDNTFIFLQYVFVLMSSHAYVLYLVAIKPYQSPLLNNYVLSNETFYSAVIIAIFIFSDATPELPIKFAAGVVLMMAIFMLMFANFLMLIVLVVKGRDRLKDNIREAKLKRAEKELMEEEEEEERRQRQKKEEEEFTRLPEDTTQMSHYDMTSTGTTNINMTTNSEMLNLKGQSKKRKKSKNKNKNNNDDVDEVSVGVSPSDFTTSEMGNTTTGLNDTHEPMKGKKHKDEKKKKKRKDKNKGKEDNLESVSMGASNLNGPDDEFVLGEERGVDGRRQPRAARDPYAVADDEDQEFAHPAADPNDVAGKKTKGSTDEPSGTSSSDKKKVKKSKSKKSKRDPHLGTPDGDLL